MVSKDQCAPVHIYVNNRSDSWCSCAWNPALRESPPGSGACDWPRLVMVAGAASIEIVWKRWSKGVGWGGGKGGGGGATGGGLWAKWGQWGVRVEKVPRGYKFLYTGLGGDKFRG